MVGLEDDAPPRCRVVAVAFYAAIAADPLRIAVAVRPSRNPLRAATAALGDPTIRRLVGSAAATAAAMEILLLYQVRIMTAVGLAASAASGFAGARGLAQLLGRLPLTRTIAHFGVRATMVAARIGLAVGCTLIVWSGHTWVAVVYVFVAGATLGALSPLEGIFATITLPPDDLGSLMGGLALLSGVAGAAGPVLAAVIVDATHRTAHAAILAAGCAALGAVILPVQSDTFRGALREREERSASTRPRISSRIGRTASTSCPAGSSSSQSSYRLPGYRGQASPQPMVMTTSAARTTSSVHGLGNSAVMSMPTSAITAIAAGLICDAGSDPPDQTVTLSPAR